MRMMMSSTFSPGRYQTRAPLTPIEALRIYFSILFGVTAFMMAFYYMSPLKP